MAQPQPTQTNSPPPQGPPRAAADEIDLIDYLLVIWRHRWMIAIVTVVAMGATVGLMLTKPRRYQANATIVPPVEVLEKQSGIAGGLGGLGNSMLRNIIDSGSIAGIYVEILSSREVAEAIIDQFDLMNVYEGVENRTQVRAELAGNTSIKTTDEGAVKIAVTDLDPNRAATIANAYVAELDRQNKRLSTGEATSKRVFLESRLKDIESKLSRIDSIPAHEAQVQEMLYEWLVRECELAKMEEAKSMPTLQVLDEAIVPELPVARGTVRKGILAGIAAMMLGIFLAFAREYAAAVKDRSRPSAAAAAELPPGEARGPAARPRSSPPVRQRKPIAEIGSAAR